MSSRLFDDLPVGISTYVLAALLPVAVVVVFKLTRPSKLDAIPTVGSTSWLGAWWGGITYLSNVLDVMQEGYEMHKRAPFKIPALFNWMVMLGSPEHVEELRRAPDDVLSVTEGINDHVQIEFTMGPGIHHNPYHVQILRSRLTRNIGTLCPVIRNEIITAFDDVLDLTGHEWKRIPVASCMQQVICRTTNRIYVGLPLCRDPDWVDLNIQFARHVVKGALVTRLFPTFLKPLAARLFTEVVRSKERGMRLLRPIIEERQKCLAEHGDQWVDKPNDLLSWLMEEAEGPELTVESLTTRLLAMNFVGVHTTSSSFTNALFHLAANPKYIPPLREEVESIVSQEGWTKPALAKMQKIDSFLKEAERMEGVSGVTLRRKAIQDFTFSDGTFIPKGTVLVAATRAVHRDDELYPNAHAFEPFRFADMRDGEGEGVRHHLVSTASDYLAFGHGRHACPGRFFAASELKTMLAHVVMMYDIKLEESDRNRPWTVRMGTSTIPDPNARILFRKRAD